jgi:hypothetical protein
MTWGWRVQKRLPGSETDANSSAPQPLFLGHSWHTLRGTNHLRVVWEAALNFSKWAFAKSGCFNFE